LPVRFIFKNRLLIHLLTRDDKDQTERVKILAHDEKHFGNRQKKSPHAVNGKGADFPEIDTVSTAGSATGTGTAATAAERIGSSNGKPGPISGFNEIHFDGPAFILQICIDKKFQAAFLVHFIAIFWLIQSQPKRWATSATLHQRDANSRTDLVLLQVGFQIVDSKRCDFEHSASSKSKKGSFPWSGKECLV